MDYIKIRLTEMSDEKYRDFHSSLMPTVEKNKILGVRTPALRAFAKEFYADKRCGEFLCELPHEYYDENNLHGYIISLIKDYDECIYRTEQFLPFIDNWATCDTMRPKIFAKNKDKLISHIDAWLSSNRVYTVRYGVGMLMSHYLDDDFDPAYLERICALDMSEYYVSMMVAWYFATALCKQHDAVLPYFEKRRLDSATHNRAIQKAVDSRRISEEEKEYLKTLKYGR